MLSNRSSCDGSPCYEPLHRHRRTSSSPTVGFTLAPSSVWTRRPAMTAPVWRGSGPGTHHLLKSLGGVSGRKLLCVPARFGSSRPVVVRKARADIFDRHRKLRIVQCRALSTSKAARFAQPQRMAVPKSILLRFLHQCPRSTETEILLIVASAVRPHLRALAAKVRWPG